MNNSIYPQSFINNCTLTPEMIANLPKKTELQKKDTLDSGVGIFAMRSFMRGEIIGSFIGEYVNDVRQHTLQISPNNHIHDPYFVGFLLHSCSPNVILDMHQQKIFCIRDIGKNEALTMDYASTEDRLFNQFACVCGAPNCRKWVSGRAEHVNENGILNIITQNPEHIYMQANGQQHNRKMRA